MSRTQLETLIQDEVKKHGVDKDKLKKAVENEFLRHLAEGIVKELLLLPRSAGVWGT